MWSDGVQTHDVSSGETFPQHTCIMDHQSISDFLTYESLSGWSMAGFQHVRFATLRQQCCHSRARNGHSRVSHAIWVIVVTCLLVILGDIIDSTGKIGEEKIVTTSGKSGEYILHQFESVPKVKPGKNPNNKDRKRRHQSCFENWVKKSIFFELRLLFQNED